MANAKVIAMTDLIGLLLLPRPGGFAQRFRERNTRGTKGTRRNSNWRFFCSSCASCASCAPFPICCAQSFGQQRERPDRAASRHFARCIASCKNAAESRRDGYILAAFVRVGDRRRIDARTGLELPNRFACVLVERNELTRQFAREHKPAAGRQHAGGTG